MSQTPRDDSPRPIDHSKLIDGFAELEGHSHYLPFDSHCGICDMEIHVTPADQKYVTEVKGAPVKMLRRGALFCEACRVRRARIRVLQRSRPRRGSAEIVELRTLKEAERAASGGHRRVDGPDNWPYGE